ncbi:MAG: UDP-3-O-(3-hydroxymyristoyl)glucosamine N-acyltransferase [Flavobacteriales bacterium]
MTIPVKQIIEHYKNHNFPIHNSDKKALDFDIRSPRSIQTAKKHHISFIGKKFINSYVDLVTQSEAEIIFIDQTFEIDQLPESKIYISTENPKQEMIDFSKHFLRFQQKATSTNIHPKATIHESVKIGINVTIAPNVVIEEDVEIGDYCTIGAGTILKANTIIKNYVEIGANNVIGGCGFGYVQDKETKIYEQFPHFGSVIIHDNVEIGNNNCLDQGSLSDTIIHKGVKIDNLVHIAHNVEVGSNTLLTAHIIIAGSVKVGENCWIAPHASITNNINIGNNVTVGIGSSVFRSVPDGETVVGSPAMNIKDYSKITRHHRKLIKNKE